MEPQCHPNATLMQPQCYPHGTLARNRFRTGQGQGAAEFSLLTLSTPFRKKSVRTFGNAFLPVAGNQT